MYQWMQKITLESGILQKKKWTLDLTKTKTFIPICTNFVQFLQKYGSLGTKNYYQVGTPSIFGKSNILFDN